MGHGTSYTNEVSTIERNANLYRHARSLIRRHPDVNGLVVLGRVLDGESPNAISLDYETTATRIRVVVLRACRYVNDSYFVRNNPDDVLALDLSKTSTDTLKRNGFGSISHIISIVSEKPVEIITVLRSVHKRDRNTLLQKLEARGVRSVLIDFMHTIEETEISNDYRYVIRDVDTGLYKQEGGGWCELADAYIYRSTSDFMATLLCNREVLPVNSKLEIVKCIIRQESQSDDEYIPLRYAKGCSACFEGQRVVLRDKKTGLYKALQKSYGTLNEATVYSSTNGYRVLQRALSNCVSIDNIEVARCKIVLI